MEGTMKEFRVEMFVNNKWIAGRSPNGGTKRIFTNYMDAIDCHDRIIVLWGEHESKVKKHYPTEYDSERFPHDFRIVRREVTEWESIN